MSGLVDPLREPLVTRAALELVLLAVSGGALGCWIVLWRLSYSAESLAHGMLPGLVGAALLGVPLLLGGALGLLAAAALIALAGRVPRLDPSVAVAVVISSLLGLGVLLGLSPQTPAGLDAILFGDVLGVGSGEIALAGALVIAVGLALTIAHPTLLAVGFDRAGGRVARGRVAGADLLLGVLLALTTLVAVQALGSLLVVALLVGPAASARLVTTRIVPAIALASLLGAVAAICGLLLSYHAEIAAGASVTACIAAAYALVLVGRSAATLALRRHGALA